MSTKDLPFYGSWKGRVIKAIAIDGARTWDDVRDLTGIWEDSLNLVLKELYSTKSIYKTEDGQYRVAKDLYTRYKEFFEKDKKPKFLKTRVSKKKQVELIRWIQDWASVKRLDVDLKKEHIYLSERYLDDFEKEIISNTSSEVLIINPYVKRCALSETLKNPPRNNIPITLLTRDIDDPVQNEYLRELKNSGVKVLLHKTIHAKMIIADRIVAVVSSMNLTPQSSGGQSWESGIVTITPKIVENVLNSVLEFIEKNEIIEL